MAKKQKTEPSELFCVKDAFSKTIFASRKLFLLQA